MLKQTKLDTEEVRCPSCGGKLFPGEKGSIKDMGLWFHRMCWEREQAYIEGDM